MEGKESVLDYKNLQWQDDFEGGRYVDVECENETGENNI